MEWKKVEGTNVDFWKPNISEVIAGKVIEIREGTYGKQHVIEGEGLEKPLMLPSHKQLQGLLSSINVGAVIKVQLVRQEPPKVRGENPLNIYEVHVQE